MGSSRARFLSNLVPGATAFYLIYVRKVFLQGEGGRGVVGGY